MSKIILYQIFTRLFGNDNTARIPGGSIEENGCGKLAAFTPEALAAIKELGTTHIWYTGIIEHATQTDYSHFGIRPDHKATVKGKAGSPYAIKDYYDVDPDLATSVPSRMKEFTQLVKRTHDAGLKMIIDFVPNHVARCYHSDAKPKSVVDLGEKDDTTQFFSPKNNFYYLPGTTLGGEVDWQDYTESPARATGNDRFDAYPTRNDWYETVKLNYGVNYLDGGRTDFYPFPSTWLKMRDILLFWAKKGVDGFRCDMAEMVPVAFWEWAIPQVKQKHPDILFIAEVYNPAEYRNYLFRGHFDYLYDKVGLYDTLRAVVCGQASATSISRAWQSLGGIEKQMLNFLENHDEQRIASEFFAGNPRKAIPALITSACMNTNPMMIYFGQEFGERGMDSEGFSGRDGRTTIFDYWSLDTVRRWYNNGECDGAHLTSQEKWLRSTYAKILSICNKEKSISEGTFFDLMYVNLNNPDFNPHRQFAFLRHYGDETLLIVANFDHQTVDVKVNIPNEAFNYMDIPDGQGMCVELLSGTRQSKRLTRGERFELSVGANSASIWRIRKKNFKPI